ncbi:MAG: hypothetical protein KC593_02480 [Myxococcales bacterium]|nr:hypothetical protein [Myxococcales bacterium]
MNSPPGPQKQQSSVPTFLVIGGLALLGLPCFACILGVFVLRMMPTDPAAVAAGRGEIAAYYTRLTALAPNIPDLSGPAVPCADDIIRAGHTQQDGTGRTYIPSVRFQTLQRWAAHTPGDPPADGFEWLDSFAYVDAAALTDGDVADARYRTNTLAQQRYLAVFRAGIARAPQVVGGNFENGLFIGRLLIIDTVTGQTMCHTPVAAQSSESVSVGGLLNPDDADDAVGADLRDQLQRAATDALRTISAQLFLGTSPTIGR